MRFNSASLRVFCKICCLIITFICFDPTAAFALTCGTNQTYIPSYFYGFSENECSYGGWGYACVNPSAGCYIDQNDGEIYGDGWDYGWICPEACYYEVLGVSLSASPQEAVITGNTAAFTAQAYSAGPNDYLYQFWSNKYQNNQWSGWTIAQNYGSGQTWNWSTPSVTGSTYDYYNVAVDAMTRSKYNAFGQFFTESESDEAVVGYYVVKPLSPFLGPGYLLDFAVKDEPYYNYIYVVGGDNIGPYAWQITSGNLPNGLTLNTSTGEIEGIPTQAGTYIFTVEVTDGVNLYTRSKQFTLKVASPLMLYISNSFDSGNLNTPYNETIETSGGMSPYRWSISSGSLPPGLTIDANTGTISGTPTASGSFSFEIEIEHEEGYTDNGLYYSPSISWVEDFTINIYAPLSITTNTLPNASYGTNYNTALAATGGQLPYTYSIHHGVVADPCIDLPSGLTLSSGGVISGIPATWGNFTGICVMVEDSQNPAALSIKVFALTVYAPLSIITVSPLPTGTVGNSYSQSLSASGGSGVYSWSLYSGNLPNGLSLSSNGVISGTPLSSGSFTLTVQVRDSLNPAVIASKQILIVVYPALSITTTTLPNVMVGRTYNQTLAATGGSGPYHWSINTGSLPTGLTLSSTGVISGTVQSSGSSTFTVQDTM